MTVMITSVLWPLFCPPFETYPQKAFLLLACDMPFVNETAIRYLMEKRNSKKTASVFVHPESKKYDSVFAIYEPAAYRILYENYKKRQFLFTGFF